MIHAPHHSHRLSTATMRVKLAFAIMLLAAIITALLEQAPLSRSSQISSRTMDFTECVDTFFFELTPTPTAAQAAVFRSTERDAEFSALGNVPRQ